LSEAGIAVPEPFQILEVAGPALLAFAPHIAQEHLASCVQGTEIWTLGFSEPGSGSDLGSVRSQLSATATPGEFRLNGQKTWNGLGHLAEYSLVLCRSASATPGDRDLTMAFVPLRADGVTTRPIRAMTGRNEFAEIFFDDARVDERDLIGGMGSGWKVIAYLMQYERGTYAWPRQARLHRLLDEVVALDGGDRTHLATRVGQLYLDLVALRVKCRESLRLLAEPGGSGPGPEASIDKLLLVRAETALMTLGRDLLYPNVEVGDSEEARRWRQDYLYVRALAIFGGTNEIQRNIVAERVLGMPRERTGG
jgi:alkylation response protein AidB-like acyl-CoA dehydrogenase